MLGVGGVRCVGESEVGDRTGQGAAVGLEWRVSFVGWRTGLIWYPGGSLEGAAQRTEVVDCHHCCNPGEDESYQCGASGI